jgi:hypothetical protein
MFRGEKAFHTLDDGSNGSMVMYSCQAVHSRNDDLGAEGMKENANETEDRSGKVKSARERLKVPGGGGKTIHPEAEVKKTWPTLFWCSL